jgi:hypothetical protein
MPSLLFATPEGGWSASEVTSKPTAEWIADQVIDAFPWDQALST